MTGDSWPSDFDDKTEIIDSSFAVSEPERISVCTTVTNKVLNSNDKQL